LAQSIADTRPFGSAVSGTRVFVDLRGHGGSAAPESDAGWTYGGLSDDVLRVADAVSATRALGVSLGAGALLRLLTEQPTRFERVVLALPPVVDAQRSDAALAVTDALADAVLATPGGDATAMVDGLLAMQPTAVRTRTDAKLWARRHAAEIGGRAGIAAALRHLPRQVAVASFDELRAVSADVLVLAQRHDEAHPVAAAEQVASALPKSELVVSDTPWIWGGRAALREVVSEFLNRSGAGPE
jgi:pimeloyl-ACP methyl ester carboxylesterase